MITVGVINVEILQIQNWAGCHKASLRADENGVCLTIGHPTAVETGVALSEDEDAGALSIENAAGKFQVALGGGEDGGYLSIYGAAPNQLNFYGAARNNPTGKIQVALGGGEGGGYLSIYDKTGKYRGNTLNRLESI
ncbi:MAG TPA: hypothetical protein DIT99_23565 [Candidatus Latescibacteria bacterium]|nr:hypothetical protein [Candidatus Latescibacterota bacterium]